MYKKKIESLKEKRGVTLVALVVTIIVLIILAAISITAVLGENGLMMQAKTAANMTKEAAENETIEQNSLITKLKEIIGETGNGESGGLEENPTPTIGKTDGSYSEEKKVNTPKVNETQGMKLITFNEETKIWEEDTTKSDYDYKEATGTADNTESRWANAKVTKDGIDSYFVWIPRYAYKIIYYTDENKTTVSTDNTAYGNIDVKFIKGTGAEATDGTICKYADDSTLTADDYIIHPAFTSNAELGGGFGELSGLWIGKYKASCSDATATVRGSSTTLKVVPNVCFGNYYSVGSMFSGAREYNTTLKSHMLKNSEWGAVVYLTHSKYGRNGNKVAENQCMGLAYEAITGAGPGIDESTYTYDETTFETTYSYTSEQGKKASTTGNVYGIYDTSSMIGEFTASYYNGDSVELQIGKPFAIKDGTSNEWATVYEGQDKYTGTEENGYKKGDATYETKEWLDGKYIFPWATCPFFVKGIYGTFSSKVYRSVTIIEDYSYRVCLVEM